MQTTCMAGVMHTKRSSGLGHPLWTLHALPWLADAFRARGCCLSRDKEEKSESGVDKSHP